MTFARLGALNAFSTGAFSIDLGFSGYNTIVSGGRSVT